MNISSSSSSSYVNNPSSNKGFSGMASGMDTEAMVEALLSGTQSKIDKQNQLRQQTVWKQEIYREIITQLNNFQSKYFGSGSSTNFLSDSFFKAMSAVASSNAFSVVASSSASVGNTSIEVKQLASAAKVASANKVSGTLSGELDLEAIKENAINQDRTVSLVVGNKQIDVDFKDLFVDNGELKTPPPSQQEIVDHLNTALDGSGAKAVLNKDNEIEITTESDDVSITVGANSSTAGLQILGLTSGSSSSTYTITPAQGDTPAKRGSKLTGGAAVDTGSYYTVEVTLNKSTQKSIQVDMNQILKDDGSGEIDPTKFGEAFNKSLKSAFGDAVQMTNIQANPSATGKFTFELQGKSDSTLVMITGNNEALQKELGVVNGQSNRVELGGSLDMYFGDAGWDADGNASFSINGVQITINKDMTVGDMIRKVNASKAGVTMAYQPNSDKFVLTSNNTGSGFDIEMSDSSGNLLSKMFGTAQDGSGRIGDFSEGKNSIAIINGEEIERTSNTIEYDGLTIGLKAQTSGVENIGVTRNTDQIVEGIKSFVKDYNEILDKLNGLISEETNYREYAPLTDAQKKEMTEKEITAWEEKAKQGLLRNDNELSTFLQSMRSTMYQKPAGATYALYNLGIETGEWEQKGKLVIDEAKLRSMIESNAEDVAKLFTDSEDGLGVKLDKILTQTASTSSANTGSLVQIAGMKGSATEASSDLYKRLKEIDDKIKTLKNNYELEKTRYWNKFNAMEKMISQMSSQSSWLSQQFGY